MTDKKNSNKEILNKNLQYASHLLKTSLLEKLWLNKDALIGPDGIPIKYTGQSYDKNRFRLVKGAWLEDHCKLCESSFMQGNIGMTSDELNWLCICCYQYVLVRVHSRKGTSA